MLASSCGTPGLGTDSTKFGNGGAFPSGPSTGTAQGGAQATGGQNAGTANGGSSTGIVFEAGIPDGQFGVCVPATCTELKANCGPQGDGCGNLIQCGNCQSPATCGGGNPSVASQCGGGGTSCTMKTCADWGANCGPVSDGCGGLLQCGTCTAPQTCGGGAGPDGGLPGQCGGDMGCVPTTCAAAGVDCGPIGDGCGGIVQCGGCAAPQTCGGGGVPSVCGNGTVDAAPSCTPRTCAQLGFTCGPAGDGCGGQLDCGTCTAPKTCGGGGTPSVCGGNTGCVPLTCAAIGHDCGPAGDGCGGVLDCGTCMAPKTCGGGGPGKCGGTNNCVPKTCASEGFNCGPAGDGCGGLLNCGTCIAGEICGGGGVPSVCGPLAADGGSTCTGLCTQQVTCDGGGTTTITGTVYAPNGTDPLYAALVYVPNGGPAPAYGVTAFTPGVHCGSCGSEVSGSPLVTTNTAVDGTFELQNVPVGTNIPLVIQLGRWRRKIVIPTVTACTNNVLTAVQTSLPSVQAMGDPADNIPLMAFSTGAVDGLECVLRKMGVADSQFSDPAAQGGNGRIRFYLGEGDPGARYSAKTPSATQLWGAGADGGTPDIDQYDIVYFACQGNPYAKTTAQQDTVINYANAGGRVFATHYSYVWYDNDPPFSTTATWIPNTADLPDQTGYINTTFPRGQALAQWLQITGSSTVFAQMPLNTLREDFSGVNAPSLLWVSLGAPPNKAYTYPMYYTFDTPVGTPPAAQCGRALFDDFHVESANNNNGITFPAECPALSAPATPQEKLLEFSIFDLSSCIIPTVATTPTCTPRTCAQQGLSCGPAGDGCGGQLDCGSCVSPATCGGGGTPGVCGGVPCTPVTCASQNITCGPASDGCGNLLQCGNCPNSQTCGGGGVPGKCGKGTCVAETCKSQGIQCGPAGDGCGGILECGSCPAGESCGGGGKPGVCAGPDAGVCTPESCATQGIQCGPAGDGCGGEIQSCGTCPTNEVCGGCGTPGKCGSCCMPTTCKALGFTCGPAGDGCGGLLQCGTCTAPDTCGGGGTAGQCGHQQNN